MKNKKLKQCLLTLMSGVLAVTVFGGCGSSNDEATAGEAGTKEVCTDYLIRKWGCSYLCRKSAGGDPGPF